MLLAAGLFGLLGYLRVRKIRKPERTIDSLKDSAQVFSQIGKSSEDGPRELTADSAGRPASSRG
jgi:hypothetical protein